MGMVSTNIKKISKNSIRPTEIERNGYERKGMITVSLKLLRGKGKGKD